MYHPTTFHTLKKFIKSQDIKIVHKLFNIDPYTIDTEPRAADFAKYNALINNVEDMKKWLINNDN